MTLKTCLRCDWEGDGKDAACPNCGVRLYVIVAPSPKRATPTSAAPEAPSTEPAGEEPPAPSGIPSRRSDPAPSRTDALGSPRRSPRWVGVLILVTLALIATAGSWLGSRDERQPSTVSAGPAEERSSTESSPAAASSSPTSTDGPIASVGGGRPRLRVAGIPFSIRIPSSGWERFAERGSPLRPGTMVSINRSIAGPQDAEAIIFWSTFPDGAIAQPCGILLDRVVGPSAADLAAAVATAPGTELVVGPSNVTVGGRTAKHVELVVREHRGCDPGYFYTWRDVFGGALWPKTPPRSTIRVWIVDIDRKLLFLEAETSPQASPDLEREVWEIVRSIRFEARSDSQGG